MEGRAIRLDDGDEVSEGARVEGWVLEDAPSRVANGPMTVDEARRLLGYEVAVACNRRGIDLRRVEWDAWFTERFSDLTWYSVIPGLDYEEPWPIWLPLFAHLLRLVETEPEELWPHIASVQVVTTGLLERAGEYASFSANARLIMLLVLRIVEVCEESGGVGPRLLFEVQGQTNVILRAWIEAAEERGSRVEPS